MKARIQRMMVNPNMLFHIMETDTAWRVSKGIPHGAVMRGVTLDPHTQMIHLFVEHESFEEVQIDKEVAPHIETLFKKIQ
jgi:hypothetical protein